MKITFAAADRDPASRDSKLIWEWRNDVVTRRMSRTTDPVPWERHTAWYAATDATLLVVSLDGVPAGMVRFDPIGGTHAEVSINLNPSIRGRGLGEPILAAGCTYGFETLGLQQIAAEVKSENTASIKIFTRAGFVLEREHDGMRTYQLKRG